MLDDAVSERVFHPSSDPHRRRAVGELGSEGRHTEREYGFSLLACLVSDS